MARRALVVGVSEYRDSALGKLRTPIADVDAICSALKNPSCGRFDSVVALKNISNADALAALAPFFGEANVDDTLLFFFAGHGIRDLGGELHLAFVDTLENNVAGTAIAGYWLTRIMDTSPAASQLIVLDCCFSGAVDSSSRGDMTANPARVLHDFSTATPVGVRLILTASSSIEYSYESTLSHSVPVDEDQSIETRGISPETNSVFAEAFIEGLLDSSSDADRDGIVGIDEFFEFVAARVAASGRRQTPQLLTRAGPHRGGYPIAQALSRPLSATALGYADALLQMTSELRRDRISRLSLLDEELGGRPINEEAARVILREFVFRDPDRRIRHFAWDVLRKRGPTDASRAVSEPEIDGLLPAPFAWCRIPQGLHHSRLGTFDISEFLMAKYPTTVDQFAVFVQAADGYRNEDWWERLGDRPPRPYNQWAPLPNLPRVMVSWYEAVAYTRWLSFKLGVPIRLPLEWEWEWAASGGGANAQFPWGDRWNSRFANTKESSVGQISTVDSYPSGESEFGVRGMSGNVWERCLNLHRNPERVSYSGRELRVIRGGSYRYPNWKARLDHRHVCLPERRFDDGGFRIMTSALELAQIGTGRIR